MDDGAEMVTNVVVRKRTEFYCKLYWSIHLVGDLILQRPITFRRHDNDGDCLYVHPSCDGRCAFNLHRALRRTWSKRLCPDEPKLRKVEDRGKTGETEFFEPIICANFR